MGKFALTGFCLFAASVSSMAIAQTNTPETAAEDVGEPAPSSDTGDAPPGAPDPAPSNPVLAAPSPVAASPDTAQAESDTGIEDIVVTATRREERLQDVPVTVTALAGESIEAADISNVRNMNQVVPAFTGGRSGGVFLPVIRGVGSTGVSVGDESNVALYIDGVYQPDSTSNWVDLVEVERVEVLRGPQGTVFGRNATGGLINVITPDPSFDARGRVSARLGFMRNDSNHLDVRGYVTGPLSSTLAADLAVNYVNIGGYVEDLVRNGELGHDRVVNVRSKLLFKPSDRAKFVLTGIYMDRGGSPNVPQVLNNNTIARDCRPPSSTPGAGGVGPVRCAQAIIPDDPWEASLTQPTQLDLRRYAAAFHSQLEFNGFNLETTTGYNDVDWFQFGDSDSTNLLIEAFPANLFAKSFTQEVRLLSNGEGPLRWILGAYYFDLSGGGDFNLIRNFGAINTNFKPSVKARSYAGFAEATYEIMPSLFVTAGGRYTTENRSFRQRVDGVLLTDATTPRPGVSFNWPATGTAKKKFNKWTYRGAVRYNFAEDANVYASFGTGFKSGVFNMTGASPDAVDPETIEALEAGIKADPLHWLRTNLAVYKYKYEALQVNAKAPVGPGFILQNAATADIYGGELEVTARASRDLQVRGWVAYTNATYDKFPGAQTFRPLPTGGNLATSEDASGNQLGRTPKWSGNLGVEWGRDITQGRLGFSANAFYSSRVYYDFQNIFSQKPYVLVNAQASLTTPDEQLRFIVAVNNLTNEAVLQQIRASNVVTDGFYEMPRRISVGLEFMF